jgi:predicted FMN-binding regulatory protein PaiB
VFNRSSDFIQVELIGVYSVKLMRAQQAGDIEAAEKIDRMIRCHMKDLKTTKIAREGEQPKAPQTSPAEWASALIEKVSGKKTEVKQLEEQKNMEMISDNTTEASFEEAE